MIPQLKSRTSKPASSSGGGSHENQQTQSQGGKKNKKKKWFMIYSNEIMYRSAYILVFWISVKYIDFLN